MWPILLNVHEGFIYFQKQSLPFFYPLNNYDPQIFYHTYKSKWLPVNINLVRIKKRSWLKVIFSVNITTKFRQSNWILVNPLIELPNFLKILFRRRNVRTSFKFFYHNFSYTFILLCFYSQQISGWFSL